MDIGEPRVVMNVVLICSRPSFRKATGHAEGADNIRVLTQRIRQHLPLRIALGRYLCGASRLPLRHQRHGNDGPCPAGRDDTYCRMKEK